MNRIEIFSNYLGAVGFDAAPLAWHLAGIPMSDEQHLDVANRLGSLYV